MRKFSETVRVCFQKKYDKMLKIVLLLLAFGGNVAAQAWRITFLNLSEQTTETQSFCAVLIHCFGEVKSSTSTSGHWYVHCIVITLIGKC